MVEKLLGTRMKEQLDKAKEKLRNDYDFFIANTGYEGDGKSTLGIECCLYVDPTFGIKRIVFTPEQFEEAFQKAKPYQAILVDEAVEIFGAKTQLRGQQFDNLKRVIQGRYKNLFVVLNVTNLFLLEWYISQERIRGLLRIPKEKRGIVYIYNLFSQRKDFKFNRQNHHVTYPPPAFVSSFKPYSSPLWEQYLRKKARYKKPKELPKELEKRLKRIQAYQKVTTPVSLLAKKYPFSREYLCELCRDGKLRAVKLKGQWCVFNKSFNSWISCGSRFSKSIFRQTVKKR